MREFVCRNECALPIARVWEIKCDFEFEQRIASKEKRQITRVGEDEQSTDADGSTLVRRVIVVRLAEDVVPGLLRRWVTAEHLTSEVTCSWCADRYDKENPSVTLTHFKEFDGIEFRFSQWLESAGKASTTICTEVFVSVDVANVPRWALDMIEGIVEAQLRITLKKFATEAQREGRKTSRPEPRPQRNKGVRVSQTDDDDYAQGGDSNGGEVVAEYHPKPSCCMFRCVVCGFIRITCGSET